MDTLSIFKYQTFQRRWKKKLNISGPEGQLLFLSLNVTWSGEHWNEASVGELWWVQHAPIRKILTGNDSPSTTAILPMLNIHRQEFRLKTEVAHFLNKCNISPASLIFRSDLDLKELGDKLSLTLVDHNVLPAQDSALEPAVTRIVDHHQLLRPTHYNTAGLETTLEMVGSCSTLVAERLFKAGTVDSITAHLLYGTILMDTVCLSEAAQRTTDKDRDIINRLETVVPSLAGQRNELFQELTAAKSDLSGLTVEEVLKKDLKTISANSHTISMSSIPGLLETFCLRGDFPPSVQKFLQDQGSQAVVLMSFKTTGVNQTTVRRQLGVFSPHPALFSQLVQILQHDANPSLQLTPVHLDIPGLSLFEQKNTAASRKHVMPLLLSHLQTSAFHGTVPTLQVPSSDSDVFVNYDPLVTDDSYPASPRHRSSGRSSLGSSAQNSCPYTPQNSYVEEFLCGIAATLPSFNNKDMVERVKVKRERLGEPLTPHNSFTDRAILPPTPIELDLETLTERVRQKQASMLALAPEVDF
ncbi:PRUNE [Cordylochernes scorpioides]|uniref:PRUNE n=1 Tax=Cordylochernes scorpioides TaxID=51811 RepID=A0ABY6K5J8_9ARAC|nr:PRUNE [Cordylochernes scorpioides]